MLLARKDLITPLVSSVVRAFRTPLTLPFALFFPIKQRVAVCWGMNESPKVPFFKVIQLVMSAVVGWPL